MLDTYELRDSIVMLKQKLEDLEMELQALKRQCEVSNTSRAFGNSGSVGYSSVERSSGT
tara:strand:- start:700 stop:876 length:177 start_codon:yes stop_codon:yes gene_type:complete